MLSKKDSIINYKAFLWHTTFLAIASSFMDVDTIIPSMMIQAGGNSIHLGFLTAIMLGSSTLFQLLFASYLSKKTNKKFFLLLGIYLRVGALFLLSSLFFLNNYVSPLITIILIFVTISIFSVSGSFAGVSYTDILGKSILSDYRKKFFSVRQIISSLGMLSSSFLVRYLIKKFDYPMNYFYLFIIAGVLLLIASGGFLKIKEPLIEPKYKKSLFEIIKSIPAEIKKNKNLKYYIILLNISSLYFSTLPFLIIYAKQNFGLSKENIGNFLILRITGVIITSFLLIKISKSYKFIMKLSFIIGGIIPVFAVLLSNNELLYQSIFIIAGISIAALKIAKGGILLEISNNENRALYTGITGATNLTIMIFPIISGILIKVLSFEVIFFTVSLLVLSSIFIINKFELSE